MLTLETFLDYVYCTLLASVLLGLIMYWWSEQ